MIDYIPFSVAIIYNMHDLAYFSQEFAVLLRKIIKKLSISQFFSQKWAQEISVFVLVFLIAFLRMPNRILHGFLWGEDGKIFIKQAYDHGASSLFMAYAGYLHTIPRLITLFFIQIFPINFIPYAFALTSALILCIVCVYLYHAIYRIFSNKFAWIAATAPILVPCKGEVLLNLTNLQWVIAPALLIFLLEELYIKNNFNKGISTKIIRIICVLLCTLTGPFGVIFSPLVLLGLGTKLKARQSWNSWVILAVYFISVTTQILIMTFIKTPDMTTGIESHHSFIEYINFPWVTEFLYNLALSLVFPASWINHLGQYWILAASILVGITTFCFLSSIRKVRYLNLILISLAIGLWVLGVIRTGNSGLSNIHLNWYIESARYFYVPFIFLTWAIALSATTSPKRPVRIISYLLLLLILNNSLNHFRPTYIPTKILYNTVTHQWQLIIPPSPQWNIDL